MRLTVCEIKDGPHKVDLPESAMNSLKFDESPLTLRLSAGSNEMFVGVREFSAPENSVRISESIAKQGGGIAIGDSLDIEFVTLPKGTEIILRASASFDWKALLELWLPANYTALSVGDVLTIRHLGKTYELDVVHLEPSNAVCIIDTDMALHVQAPPPEVPARKQFALGETIQLSNEPVPIENPGITVLEYEGVVCVGPEYSTAMDSFAHRYYGKGRVALDTTDLGERLALCGDGAVVVTRATPEPMSAAANTAVNSPAVHKPAGEECPICQHMIPEQSLLLHSAFCARNTIKCSECGQPLDKRVYGEHWHCHCGAHNLGYRSVHDQEHTCDNCVCGFTGSFVEVAHHRAKECPLRLHVCQFCHLLFPQGETSPAQRLQGLTGHEAACGSKTVDCPFCSKPIRRSVLAFHLEEHEAARRARVAPKICANRNCPQIIDPSANASLGLCPLCFGPLYSSVDDFDGSKLQGRVERRYLIQLSRGCGKGWCQNKFCRTGSGIQRTVKEALPVAAELMETAKTNGEFWFCVDELMTRKAMFVYEDGVYERGWRGMAIMRCATVADAEHWLERHASKIGES